MVFFTREIEDVQFWSLEDDFWDFRVDVFKGSLVGDVV